MNEEVMNESFPTEIEEEESDLNRLKSDRKELVSEMHTLKLNYESSVRLISYQDFLIKKQQEKMEFMGY